MSVLSLFPFLNRSEPQQPQQSMDTTQQLSSAASNIGAAVAPISPLAALVIFGVAEAIKIEPAIAAELQKLFSKGIPTEEDWAAERARIATPFSALAPNSAAQIATAESAAPSVTTAPAGEVAQAQPAAPTTPAPAVTLAALAPVPVQLLSHAQG